MAVAGRVTLVSLPANFCQDMAASWVPGGVQAGGAPANSRTTRIISPGSKGFVR
jgi:hypothetical protein